MRWVWLWSSWIFEPASYPVDTRREAGFQLDKVQRGLEPDDWKPMNIVGPGVREIRIFETTGIFRVIYVANIGESIYVLHAFQKKTHKTSQWDLELARARFNAIGDK